ncbi:alpha/beta fold hydrolase [Pelagibaculum spongiae]|uniref:Proline iminopeptidase n=1 Tax=Pelagibaculum spongiae TaxID=2080658 RepID=A0A2V1GRL2_9GAMM|nr:alpha/beta fold hydrolase [Pelagibaculum spongiae]PVZ63407.1 alpha/beta hydrolase [Pelagibaculum spongiae]
MNKNHIKLIACAIVATSALSACSDSSKTVTKSYRSIDCEQMLSTEQMASLTPSSSCGFLSVPEIHAIYGEPASEKNIEIAVVKLASTSSSKKSDPVVYLEGGPGGSAIASISRIARSATFLDERDVYLVDQRGTGYSRPALFCTEYSGEAGTPDELRACKARLEGLGANLNAYNSIHNAMDFIQLRKSLGIPEWNIYGISYGTRLATTIIRENNEGIRSVILDGVFPIEVNGLSDTSWSNYESLNQILINCNNSTDCSAIEFYNTVESILARMHNAGMIEESRVFIQNLINFSAEPTITDYLSAVNADISSYALILEEDESESGSENIFYNAMGLSTVCAEEYYFLGQSVLNDNSEGWSEAAQITINGMYHMGFDDISCEAWDVAGANDIEKQAVSSNLPVLILNGTNDTQTPVAWGNLVAQNLTNSQSATNPRGGHGQLFADEACFEELASAFIKNPNHIVDQSCVLDIPAVSYDPLDN